MLRGLEKEGKEVGFKINRSKTKLMCVCSVCTEDVYNAGSSIYLGQEGSTNLAKEISRRRKAGWLKLNEEKEVLLSKIDPKRKEEIFNTTVLSAMIYECETWAPTRDEERRLETTVRSNGKSYAKNHTQRP
ncbi:hypothetical protein ANCDUO_19322 [Ancylostoma duodenale]|uniref:Reverse transcriptase domain-containing protein n=1 Tax=Ancylostoma duodenale TaxID=51022 RepID=A0A0C2G0I6_9BILA|nr:hypothetical protein ANCDUO_19322 [Ancylostoma duodenale]